jgi:diguanylate cyclase (GGDEF)-like protein
MDHNGMKNNHTVSRLGGDEFLILVQGIGERNDIAVVAQKIIDSLNKSIKLVTEHGKFYLPEGVGASIGISFYPDHVKETKDIISHADEAMRAAKETGKGRYVFYDDLSQKDHPDDQE